MKLNIFIIGMLVLAFLGGLRLFEGNSLIPTLIPFMMLFLIDTNGKNDKKFKIKHIFFLIGGVFIGAVSVYGAYRLGDLFYHNI